MKVQIIASAPNADGVKHPTGIKILSLPKSGLQRIPVPALDKHAGYITLDPDKITYHTVDGDVVFNIIHGPGRYCLTCDEKLPDHGGNGTMLEAQRAAECLAHVAGHGKKAETSDAWPKGYSHRPNTFDCTIEDKRNG